MTDVTLGQAFADREVAALYRHRPPYPKEIFDILVSSGSLRDVQFVSVERVMRRDIMAVTESTEIRVAISLLEQCGELRRGFDLPRAISLYIRRAPETPDERELIERARLRPRQRLTLAPAEWCARLGVTAEALEPTLLQAADSGWLEYRGSGRAMRLERVEGNCVSREKRAKHPVGGGAGGGFPGSTGRDSARHKVPFVRAADPVHRVIDGRVQDGEVARGQGWGS